MSKHARLSLITSPSSLPAVMIAAGLLSLGLMQSSMAGPIGISAPLSGPYQMLGEQLTRGIQKASDNIGDAAPSLSIRDDQCSRQGGEDSAKAFIQENVSLVMGYLCNEAIEGAMPILGEAGIPILIMGARLNALTDRQSKTHWPIFRLAPREDAERVAAAEFLLPLWRDKFFAIIDDGTIHARELAESFRAAAEQKGLKPAYVDTYRPQLDNQVGLVGRLKRAGATHVLIGGDKADIAIIARDAAALDYQLEIASGESLRDASSSPDLTDGILMISQPQLPGELSLEARAQIENLGEIAEGYFLTGYAGLEIAAETISKGAADSASIAQYLKSGTFSTLIGPVKFDEKGDLADNPYRLFRFDGGEFKVLDLQ